MCRRALLRGIAAAFFSWHNGVEILRDRRDRLADFALKLCSTMAWRVFGGWSDYCMERRALAAVVACAGRLLLRIQKRETELTLAAWYHHVKARTQLRYSLQKVMKRWLRLLLAGPFAAWQQFLKSAKHAQLTVKRALHRAGRVALATAFSRWSQHAFANWQLETLVKKAVRRIPRRIVSCTFQAWHETYHSHKAQRVQQRRTMYLLHRVLRRHVSVAYHGWVHRVSGLRRQRQMAHRLLLRWQLVHLRFYFQAWTSSTAFAASSRRLCNRGVARIGRIKTFAAVRRWRQLVASKRRLQQRKAILLQRTLHRRMLMAYHGWSRTVSTLQQQRQTAQRLLLSWQLIHLRFYFKAWTSGAASAASCRRLCRRGVTRVGRVKVIAAVRRWRQHVVSKCQVRHGMRSMRSLRVTQSFGVWRAHTEGRRISRAVLRRAERLLHRVLSSAHRHAFFAWIDAFSYRESLETFIRLARARAARRHIVVSFAAWRRSVHTSRTLDALGSFAVTGVVVRTVRSLLARWVEAGPPPLVTSLHLSRKSAMMSKF
jgi:hypothetical protein